MSELLDYFLKPIVLEHVTIGSALLRILVSFFAGFLVGYQREKRRQPAGLRTHILICVASTLIMLVSITISTIGTDIDGKRIADASRIAAQVVSGIGFLGAGVIMQNGINIRGLTSAATIWAISGIGLAIGIGLYIPAIAVLLLFLLVLVFIEAFEKRFMPAKITKKLGLRFRTGSVDIHTVIQTLSLLKISVEEYSISTSLKSNQTSMTFLISSREIPNMQILTQKLEKIGKLEKIRFVNSF